MVNAMLPYSPRVIALSIGEGDTDVPPPPTHCGFDVLVATESYLDPQYLPSYSSKSTAPMLLKDRQNKPIFFTSQTSGWYYLKGTWQDLKLAFH